MSAQLVTDAVSVDLGERSLRAVATKVMSGSTPHFGPVYTRVQSTPESKSSQFYTVFQSLSISLTNKYICKK